MEISFDEFYKDLLKPDGSVWIEDVLFIRGTAPVPGGEISYMVPMIEHMDLDEELVKEIIASIIEQQIAGLCLN
jgi:hypothetical protein